MWAGDCSSRTLAALAEQGNAPRMFAYIDRRGRPLVAILAASAVGLLSYLADYGNHSRVFDWLLAISGLSAIFAWGSTCLAHIRMRRALVRRYSIANLPFRAQGGVWGSWVGLVCNAFLSAAQVWVSISPVRREGDSPHSAAEVVQNFFIQCLALPVVLICWLGHKLWFRTSFVRLEQMYINTGRKDFESLGVTKAQQAQERQA